MVVLFPLHEFEGAGADRVLTEFLFTLFFNGFLADNKAGSMGQTFEEAGVGLIQLELDGVVIRHFKAALFNITKDMGNSRSFAGPFKGKGHIFSFHFFTIVELHTFAQVENIGDIIGEFPTLSQNRDGV